MHGTFNLTGECEKIVLLRTEKTSPVRSSLFFLSPFIVFTCVPKQSRAYTPLLSYMQQMTLNIFTFLGLLFSVAAAGADFAGERALPVHKLCHDAFAQVFHGISKERVSVTTLRHENRVVTHKPDADAFLASVRHILGDDVQTDPDKMRLNLRDVPDSDELKFITTSDYLRNVIGVDAEGKEVHRTRIRRRKYIIVEKGMTVDLLATIPPQNLNYAKLADGEGPFSKLEFKVGYPVETPTGELVDKPGVVEKPGIVMADADIDLLLSNPEAYRAHRAEITEKTKAFTVTKKGQSLPVNHPDDVEEMIKRIGWLHEQKWGDDALQPQSNMKYVRNAYKVSFPIPGNTEGKTFEVQITFDEDMVQTYLASGNIDRSVPGDTVVELKIPIEYSDLSDKQLGKMGLGELAKLRAQYMAMPAVPDTQRERGKRSNMLIRNKGNQVPAATAP